MHFGARYSRLAPTRVLASVMVDSKILPPTRQMGLWISLRIAAVALRSVFLITLVALAVRVSLPQSEKIWTIYDEPRDAVRLILGFVVSVWIVYHLFRLPRDAQGYRIWARLGIILVPLTLATLFAFW